MACWVMVSRLLHTVLVDRRSYVDVDLVVLVGVHDGQACRDVGGLFWSASVEDR
jgi:hypothetical protein